MTGNLQAIGFVFSWVLGWGIGGSLIDAGLINAGVYSLEGGQLGTAATFILWSLLWGGWRGLAVPALDQARHSGALMRCGRRAVSISRLWSSSLLLISRWAIQVPVNLGSAKASPR